MPAGVDDRGFPSLETRDGAAPAAPVSPSASATVDADAVLFERLASLVPTGAAPASLSVTVLDRYDRGLRKALGLTRSAADQLIPLRRGVEGQRQHGSGNHPRGAATKARDGDVT
ncbi:MULTISPECIES: hypothetical protein [unclassified Streptomyces]|uniref:hypothetical protein n=1 Tax=unclassified Streptomyces TaxID=2593676 RepID=UPI0038057CEC